MPTGQLEEGRDQLEIRCLADANPPASILWRRTKSPGVAEVASIGETLLFSPIYRNHAAVYICEAANTEGESSPVSVQVSVNCKCRRPRFHFPSFLLLEVCQSFSKYQRLTLLYSRQACKRPYTFNRFVNKNSVRISGRCSIMAR